MLISSLFVRVWAVTRTRQHRPTTTVPRRALVAVGGRTVSVHRLCIPLFLLFALRCGVCVWVGVLLCPSAAATCLTAAAAPERFPPLPPVVPLSALGSNRSAYAPDRPMRSGDRSSRLPIDCTAPQPSPCRPIRWMQRPATNGTAQRHTATAADESTTRRASGTGGTICVTAHRYNTQTNHSCCALARSHWHRHSTSARPLHHSTA